MFSFRVYSALAQVHCEEYKGAEGVGEAMKRQSYNSH